MKWKALSIALSGCVAISCSSAVSLADVQKQEEKATEALNEAHEEIVMLAELKEKYSKEGVKAKIKTLKKELSEVQSDIEALENLESGSVEEHSDEAIAKLQQQSEKLDQEIERLKNLPEEDWSQTIMEINKKIAELKDAINTITANTK